MTRNKRSHKANIVLLGIAVFILLLLIIPYFIPLSSQKDIQNENPFNNSQFISVDEVEFHFRTWVNPQAPVIGKVLLVHGLGGSTYSWENNVEYLRQAGYFVVAVDLPGFGYSSRQTGLDHSQKNRSILLWQLLAAVDVQCPPGLQAEPWHLVGHSMGAGTVAAMALAKPAQTANIVIVNGALFNNSNDFGVRLIKFPPASRWLQVFLEHVLITKPNIQKLLLQAFGQEPSAEQLAEYYKTLRISGTARALADFVQTAKYEPISDLNNLAVSVHAIWGSKDSIIPISSADLLKQVNPAIDFHFIPDAWHTPMETHPAEFNPLLFKLLQA